MLLKPFGVFSLRIQVDWFRLQVRIAIHGVVFQGPCTWDFDQGGLGNHYKILFVP